MLTAFLPIAGDGQDLYDLLSGDPATWLPHPAEPAGPDAWVVTLRAGPVRHRVLCNVGVVWRDRETLWRPLSWTPHGGDAIGRLMDRALPDFVGEIGLLDGEGRTLIITGGYRPPGGSIGTASDGAGLHLVAEVSARRFLEDVSERLRASVRSR